MLTKFILDHERKQLMISLFNWSFEQCAATENLTI